MAVRHRDRNSYRIHRRLTNDAKDFAAAGFFAGRLRARQYSRGGYPQLKSIIKEKVLAIPDYIQ